jgi:riboflavin kinase/FMN adenylyltransferase
MQIIRNFHNINKENLHSFITLGNFDGVHLGHQNILRNLKTISAGEKTALLTFEPHPIKIINRQAPNDIRISSLSQKLRFIKENNLVDIIFLANFNFELANLEAKDFVKKILIDRLKIKHIAIGYDFVFGKNKGGNANLLEELAKIHGFGFTRFDAIKNQTQNIYSSTAIRKSLIEGDVKAASQMLGRPYNVAGIVVKGEQKARQIGFPTANILPKFNLLKPKFGVYQANVKLENINYPAIVNFGVKPTFQGVKPLFEAHIFNFNKEIYGKKIIIELLDFIRAEKKFSGIEELKTQIQQDCARVENNILHNISAANISSL